MSPAQRSSAAQKESSFQSLGLQTLSWSSAGDLTYQQWMAVGRRLGVVGRGSAWWIGDWIRFGANRYGGRYKVATQLTGYDEQTLTNMAWVASRFEISRRRENLTWSHHAELAALEPDEREEWLDRAERNRLTIRQLRRALDEDVLPGEAGAGGAVTGGGVDASPRSEAAPEAADEADAEGTVCPHCGNALDPNLFGESPGPRARARRRRQLPRSRDRG